MKNRRSSEVAETKEGVVTETTVYASCPGERPSMDAALLSRGSKRLCMDVALLSRGLERLCASTQGADDSNSRSTSINHGPASAKENPDNMDVSLWSGLPNELIEKVLGFAENNPHMDGNLWSDLPPDLIERVLSRVPAASLLRMRTVCKEWSEFTGSQLFLNACSQVESCKPYFVKTSDKEHSRSLLSYDTSMHRWRNVPIRYLPSEVGFPVSSSGGLICFTNNMQVSWRDGSVLFVCNPLTKAWKELPQFHCQQWPMLISIIMWKRPSHYKVIVVGGGMTEIWDSIESAWRNTGCLPQGEDLGMHTVTAFCKGSMYCLNSTKGALLAFNIQDEVWSKVKTSRSRLPGYRQYRNLVTCKDHIVIVGKSLHHQSQLQSVCVWLLDWTTLKWREKGRMPQYMSDHFLGHPSKFNCCSHGDLIFLSSGNCSMDFLFDMAQNKWCSVEAWPNRPNGISFEPRLDSQV